MRILLVIEEHYTADGRRTCRLNNLKQCQMLLATRFGTAFQCRLFTEEFGGGGYHLDEYPDHYIKPHSDCLLQSDGKGE
jgi:hypothetical protein